MMRLLDDKYTKFFINLGVPGGVVFGNYPEHYEYTISRINYIRNEKPRSITIEDQKECLQKIFTLSKPYLAVLTGKEHDAVASQVALLAAIKAVEKDSSKAFYWHSINSHPSDKVRDEEELKDVGLLILSNLAANSTTMKLEKFRDILTKYSHLPRIVVAAGMNPMDLCSSLLYVKPSYVAYFARSKGNE
jgi:hypothetical protein